MIVFRKYFIVFLLPLLSGCTAVALTGAGVGASYTLSNVAYRSFSSPGDQVHNATIAALKKWTLKSLTTARQKMAES